MSCNFHSAFDIVASAPLYSQLCGVLAALTFSALIGGFATFSGPLRNSLAGREDSSKHAEQPSLRSSSSYRALLLAFAILLLASVLWGIISGSVDSTRPRFMAIVAVWVTFLGAILMLTAIILYIRESWSQDSRIGPLASATTIFRIISVFGVATIWVTSTDALGVPGGTSWFSTFVAALIVILLAGTATLSRRTITLEVSFDVALRAAVSFGSLFIAAFGYLASSNTSTRFFVPGHFCASGVPPLLLTAAFLPTVAAIVVTGLFSTYLANDGPSRATSTEARKRMSGGSETIEGDSARRPTEHDR